MTAMTSGVAALLACLVCAPAAAAQNSATNVQEQKRETIRRGQTDAKVAAARQRAAVQRRGTRSVEADASESFTRVVRIEPGGTFDLQNISGDVAITGSQGAAATIEATKRVRGRVGPAAVRSLLNQIRIEVAERAGNVEVRTFHPRGPAATSVDYVVTLPENVNLILRSTAGNFRVEKMAGDEVNAHTLRGNVLINELRSRMLDLTSVTGDILLRDVVAQRARVESTNGNLEYAGPLRRTGRYQLQTHRGNIRVLTSGEPGFDLEAMTYSGELRSDFALKLFMPAPGSRTAAQRPRLNQREVQKVLRGTYGDAAATLTALSFSGDVFIVKPDDQERPQP